VEDGVNINVTEHALRRYQDRVTPNATIAQVIKAVRESRHLGKAQIRQKRCNGKPIASRAGIAYYWHEEKQVVFVMATRSKRRRAVLTVWRAE